MAALNSDQNRSVQQQDARAYCLASGAASGLGARSYHDRRRRAVRPVALASSLRQRRRGERLSHTATAWRRSPVDQIPVDQIADQVRTRHVVRFHPSLQVGDLALFQVNLGAMHDRYASQWIKGTLKPPSLGLRPRAGPCRRRAGRTRPRWGVQAHRTC